MLIYNYTIVGDYRPYLMTLNVETAPEQMDYLLEEPTLIADHWPCEQDGTWVQIEDHRGKSGWVNGVKLTITELGPLPENWSLNYVEPDIEAMKSYVLKLLKEKRLSVEYSGPIVEYEGQLIRFPSELKDETRLNSLSSTFAKNPDYVIENWKISDGVYATMTASLLEIVKELGMVHIQNSFAVEHVKYLEVEACNSIEELTQWLNDSLDTGWEIKR